MRFEDGQDQREPHEQFAARKSTAPELIANPDDLAADGSLAARYIAALRADGPARLIANAVCEPLLMRHGELRLPVMIGDGTYGHTYVASPHSAYVLYAIDELDIVEMRAGRTIARAVLGVMDMIFRALQLNQTVQLDNWLLSTNLHGHWKGEGLSAMRRVLTRRFPGHYPVIRSLDPWSCPDLLSAARADGWMLMPARQIWVTDDMKAQWKKRNNSQNDRRALKKSGLRVEEPEAINDDDAMRIADLYFQLYIGRYSGLNPRFTPHFVMESARSGLLEYRLARAENGTIMAVAGMRVAGDIATVPLLGYDLSRPRSEALYPIASYLASHWAYEKGLRCNGSAGAGHFKQLRGASGEIEYMAIYAHHLPLAKRAGLQALAQALDAIMVPMLRKQGW